MVMLDGDFPTGLPAFTVQTHTVGGFEQGIQPDGDVPTGHGISSSDLIGLYLSTT